MFKIGDAIVHPIHGAGIIKGIKYFGQQDRQYYYTIELLGNGKTSLMVPVDRADEIGLRTAIASSELGQVWQVLSAAPIILPEDHKKRYKMLNDRLHDRAILDVARVVRDMAWRQYQTEGNLAQKGREILQKSVRILAEEVAVSQKISVNVAEALVQSKIGDFVPSHYDV